MLAKIVKMRRPIRQSVSHTTLPRQTPLLLMQTNQTDTQIEIKPESTLIES
jgi:hypothetical protein